MTRLQRAAELVAQRAVASLKSVVHLDDVPGTLRAASRFLINSTDERRTSAAMVYYYPNTGRVSQSHPRREYEDRYCQQVLYRSMPVLDWYRVLDIDELSDTELQVVTFKLEP